MTATTLDSPYRGLASFGETDLDARLFFGRERETEIVTASLLASRLTVLYGPSGAGKSSLLRAGVARRVRELGARPAVGRAPDLACVVFSSWADDPGPALAAAVGDAVRPLVSPTAPEPPSDAGLVGVIEHWSVALDGDVCLILDQLEELFVYHDDDPPFLDDLATLLLAQHVRANTLLALRDDELARLGALKRRLPNVFANARRLERLGVAAARAAILGPLEWWNSTVPAEQSVDVEPELVDAVLRQTAVDGEHVEAPYLQLVLERVWREEATRGSRELRLATLAELGGAEVIVRDHLEDALASLDERQQQAAARMFEHLVTPSGTKIAHRASDLAAFAHAAGQESDELLDTLDRRRIVRRLDDPEGGRRYEIFHDVLAGAIIDWSSRRELTAERETARARQRRLLVVAGASLLVALVMVAVAVYALGQRSDARTQARRAHGSALAAAALAQLPNDPEVGLRLAREAAADSPTRGVEDALRDALQASRARAILDGGTAPVVGAGFGDTGVLTVDAEGVLRTFATGGGPAEQTVQLVPHVRAAAFASDGSALAVAARRLVEVRALDAGATSFGFRVRSPVRALAIAGDGARVGVATLDGRVVVRGRRGETVVRAPSVQTAVALDADGRVLAGAAGRRVTVWRNGRHAVSIDTGSDVADVALAPDGSVVATAGTDGAVRVWNVPAGTLATIAITPAQLTRVAFNRDGTALATGGTDGVTRVFARSGRPVAVLARHDEAVSALAFSPTSRLAVTGSRLGGARIWDPGIAPDLGVVARPAGCCSAFAAQPGATAVGTRTATLLLRDGRPDVTYPTGPVTALAVDDGTLLTGDHDGRVLRWSSPGARRTLVSFGEPVSAIAARGATVAAASRDGRVVVRSAGRTLRFREAAAVAGLAISPDGLRLATADADDTARVRDLRTGRVLLVLRGHTKPVTAVAFSPDGTKIATSSFDHDVRLWDAASGHPEQVLRAQFAVVRDVAFSPDGRWIVSSGPTTAALFRADTGERLAYLRGPAAALVGAAFVSARRVVAASLDGTVRSYRCGVCGGLDELLRLADARIRATGGRLTAAEQRSLVR